MSRNNFESIMLSMQIPFVRGSKEIEMDIVPMPYQEKRVPHLSGVSTKQRSPSKSIGSDEESQGTMYGTILQPVPVIIVGSHFDQIVVQNRDEVTTNTQGLVAEMKDRYM